MLKNISSSSSNSNKVYVFAKKKKDDEINKKKGHLFTTLAKFLNVPLQCSDCNETDIHLFNFGSSGDAIGFGHCMWYDSVIECDGRCFFFSQTGKWN